MASESFPSPHQPTLWIWASADGARWRITHTPEGFWSCPIGLGGKRVGAWAAGLPPSLGTWPDTLTQE